MSDPTNRRTLVALLAGLLLVAAGCIAHIAWTRASVASLASAEGHIVEIAVDRSTVRASSGNEVPVAELVTSDGTTHRLRLEGSANSPFCCDVGERVDLLYDPADPERSVRLDAVGDLYGPQAVFGLVALLFAAILGASLRGERRPKSA